jgi:hypothetical protein
MILYKCFVCGTGMESPSCLIGSTEKCPECGFSNWVPYHTTDGFEATQRGEENARGWPKGKERLTRRILGMVRISAGRILRRRSRGLAIYPEPALPHETPRRRVG